MVPAKQASYKRMELTGKHYSYPTEVLPHLLIPSVVTGFPALFHGSRKAAHVRPHRTYLVVFDGLTLTHLMLCNVDKLP